jgi:transcriptional regulator with XRE-family HTH domain
MGFNMCLVLVNFKFINTKYHVLLLSVLCYLKNEKGKQAERGIMDSNVNKMDIGGKIRELRNQNGLTQEELADRCELSKGFISQLENDLTSPSIATLIDILQCLGTDLKHFFDDADDRQIVFQNQDFFEKIDNELHNKIEWIIPNAQKNMMEPIRVTLEPDGSTYPDQPHEGEEFGYVLSGSVTIILGKRNIHAKKGEAFYYTASTEHYIKANSKNGAVFLWVSTPPNF